MAGLPFNQALSLIIDYGALEPSWRSLVSGVRLDNWSFCPRFVIVDVASDGVECLAVPVTVITPVTNGPATYWIAEK